MSDRRELYRWDARAELVTPQPDDAAIYYEWLLGLPAGVRPGDGLARIGVTGVRHAPEESPGWTPVFGVADVDAALTAPTPGGWTASRTGHAAVVRDGLGLSSRLAAREPGGEVDGEPGAISFDCSTLDVAASSEFYCRLLGLDAVAVADDAYGMQLLVDGERVVLGAFRLHGISGDAVRATWIIYFEVDSVDASVARAVQSGSRVRIPPSDSPLNRYAVLDDPWGNLYGFSALFENTTLRERGIRSLEAPAG